MRKIVALGVAGIVAGFWFRTPKIAGGREDDAGDTDLRHWCKELTEAMFARFAEHSDRITMLYDKLECIEERIDQLDH